MTDRKRTAADTIRDEDYGVYGKILPGQTDQIMDAGMIKIAFFEPVAVIISCKEGSEFDAGLACESMADMANVIGYGTKIISSPGASYNA